MWPPVNGCLSPLTITTTEVPLNIQAGHGGTLQTLNCSAREIRDQRRSMRRVARSEPLYRRADIRQQPYVISSNQRHNKPTHDQAPDQQVSLDSRITNDDIQAANILMLFAKRHLNIYNDEARTNTSATECVANSNNNNTSKNYTIPHKLLLRIVKSLRIPAFAGRARQRWKKDFTMKLMVSCMMVRHVVPSMPMPLLLQQAMHVAEQLVNHARLKKMPDEQDICCLDCGMLPVLPVTGQCGHTRCLECIRNSATCTCGTPAPQDLYVDTCVQYLIGKLLANKQSSRVALRATEQPPVRGQLLHDFVCAILGRVIQENCQALARRRTVAQRLSRGLRVSLTISPDSFSAPDVPARLPMTPQTIAILLEDREPELVAREVSGFVGQQAAESWLTSSDLECVLCRDTLVAPVTTPCGHTYCRRCIEHSMDYRRTCPLCMRDLENFNLALTKKTQFVCAALASINILHSPPPLDPSVVPVFVCVTAFPKVPCPLMISDPRYRVFIRRILESGTRRLGMVARNEDHSDSDYGTMLEVRDCVECHDGRIILSTIGISRFKIVERIMDGCLARVEMLTDKVPTDPNTIQILRLIGTEVGIKACVWIKNLEYSVRSKIERAFGKMPYTDEEWWKNPDGPDWLWWLIASLPLAPELKGMMISSSRLVTRLCAMRRSLQLVLDAAAYGHCMRDDTQ
ncbi:LON peptidase N-terminal domain and RING finger protein 2 isoform X2 [Choristoneura fumiferana]|uniref:LON peptidase N-terminal domain and RING finger protein 2 isoform X2 n=1 Tax=Choristoneura fumiferana TaxID=7141 RepID=UPI003D15418C